MDNYMPEHLFGGLKDERYFYNNEEERRTNCSHARKHNAVLLH